MTGVKIHGGMQLQGTDTAVKNFELEHLVNDPTELESGSLWLNTTHSKVSYAETNSGGIIDVRRLATDLDLDKIDALTHTAVINNTANNLIFGQPVYGVSELSIGAKKAVTVSLAASNDIYKKNVLGFVVDDNIPPGNYSKIMLSGRLVGTIQQWEFITNEVGGLIPNKKYFLDSVPGKLTTKSPNESGYFSCCVGIALSSTDLIIKIDRPIAI